MKRLAAALATLAAIGASCGEPTPTASGPNVLLITVDSLRADRLRCYGYERDTSPNLDRFAQGAVRFERAYSHAPFTAPAHASLLTSLHTPSHGVLAWAEELAPGVRTLGGLLGDAGWRTGAFHNHPGLRPSKITREFDVVRERFAEEGERILGDFLSWVVEDEAPFAAWLHLWDVHRPYAWRDLGIFVGMDGFARPESELRFGYHETRFGPATRIAMGRSEAQYNVTPAQRAERGIGADDGRFIEDRYDGGVYKADEVLGRLFYELEGLGLLDDTLVIVTADHGEALTERASCWFTHDPFLYEETLRVPLIVRFPGGRLAGAVEPTPVRHVDVLPTILEECDVAMTGDEQGVSLIPLVRGADWQPAPVYAQTQTRSAKERVAKNPDAPTLEYRRSLLDRGWKLIRDEEADSWALYDLATDPGETRDLFGEPGAHAERERMLAGFERFTGALVAREGAEVEADDSIGHMGYGGD